MGPETAKGGGARHLLLSLARWFDSWAGAGAILSSRAPHLGTSGPQMLVWGFFLSTTVLFHATSTINSLDHLVGSQRFPTGDGSRNNAAQAVLTLGEGWHNNNHRYAVSARQGFYGWEVDVTSYILWVLALLGIVRDLEPVPGAVLAEGRRIDAAKGRR